MGPIKLATIRGALVAVNIVLVVLAGYLMVSGVSDELQVCAVLTSSQTYGSVEEIIDSYNSDGGTSPWSCTDNSNSV
jgi:hypothetical protein